MPSAEQETTTQRETWADWIRGVDPDFDESSIEYSTLADLLEDLNDLITPESAKVDAVTIRYWQRKGLLPYPIKRWHKGATRSLYPKHAATHLIMRIRSLQQEGYTLEQIAPRLRGHLAMIYDPGPLDLEPAIVKAAKRREAFTGRPVREVVVSFVDKEGWRVEYLYPIEYV